MRHAKLIIAALPVLIGLSTPKAHANLIITAAFDSTWTSDANAVADEAAINNLITNSYEANFTNPINVSIDFSTMNSGLGQSVTGYYANTYDSYRNGLIADKQTINGGDGNTAFLASLPAGIPGQDNPVPGNSTAGVQFTSAQGRVLGFNTQGGVNVNGVTYDSNISLNTTLIHSDGYSLTATAAHEINEALGLGSALDGMTNNPGTATVPDVGSLDFFRYSAPGVRSFTSSGTAVSYFSDNGGTTPIVYFNQTTGADYHDWASGNDAISAPGTVVAGPQVQDAFGTPGSNPSLSAAEFTALNDIGYNHTSNLAVPEPSQLATLGLAAFGTLGLMFKARKRKLNS